MKGHRHARIVLEVIALDMFFGRAGQNQFAARIECFDLLFDRMVQQNTIGNNLRLESRCAKLLGYILRRLAILRRCGQVRLRGKSLQVLSRELGVGHCQKLLLYLRLRGKVRIAEHRSLCRLGKERCRRGAGEQQTGELMANDHSFDLLGRSRSRDGQLRLTRDWNRE